MLGSAAADILVRVKGDAQQLSDELAKGDRAVGGFSSGQVAKVAGVVSAAFAAGAVVDFANTAIGEAARVDDAYLALQGTLGDELGDLLKERAGDFAEIGKSKGDVLELQTIFAGIASSYGLDSRSVADLADDVIIAADAVADLKGLDPADVIDKIAKAAMLGEDDLAALGLHLTEADVVARALTDSGKTSAEALTDGEKAAAAYALILEGLNPLVEKAGEHTDTLRGKQEELNAKWETFTGDIGEALEGPLLDLLDWFQAGIDGWSLFADSMDDPQDQLRGIFGLITAINDLNPFIPHFGGLAGDLGNAGAPRSSSTTQHPRGGADTVTVQVQDSAPDAQERAVQDALRTYNRQNGRDVY